MKEKMITRTMYTTKGEAMAIEVTTAKVETITFTITGKLDNEETLKELKTELETATYKIVAITNYVHEEKLYGISEKDFLKYAKELEPRKKYD